MTDENTAGAEVADYAREEDNPLARETFEAVAREAYGWTVTWDGEVHGLVAGDMGYDGTGVNLGVLVAHALGSHKGNRQSQAVIAEKLEALIAACREALP